MDQGSEFLAEFKDFCDKYHIKVITTRSYARFAERFIRWVKMQLARRINAPGGWASKIPSLVTKWNSTINRGSNLTPNEAHKDENALDVKVSLIMKAKHERKYPELERGDTVRIKEKKGALDKETKPYWSKQLYKIEAIKEEDGMKWYGLDGKDGYLMRHELLKV
jgi:hypothetical protein